MSRSLEPSARDDADEVGSWFMDRTGGSNTNYTLTVLTARVRDLNDTFAAGLHRYRTDSAAPVSISPRRPGDGAGAGQADRWNQERFAQRALSVAQQPGGSANA